MNISGLGYSRLTKGLKDPKKIKDQEFKLIFIYPMLVDNSVKTYTNLLRDFIAINALKEIFISNAINMVSMASQIHPLTDERGQAYDIETSTGKIDIDVDLWGRGNYSGQQTRRIPSDNEGLKQELKQQIQNKTAIIKKMIINDPQYKAFNPYIEMITMDNFIDVPVIVGTKSYQLDSIVVMMLLMACVSENSYHLGVNAPLDKIFADLKNLTPATSWKLMRNITNRPVKEKGFITRFIVNNIFEPVKSRVMNMSSSIKQFAYDSVKDNEAFKQTAKGKDIALSTLGDIGKRLSTNQEPITIDDNLAILKTAQSNFDQAKLFFKFCLDPGIASRLHGADKQQQQFDITSVKLAGPIKDVFNNLHSRFIKTMSIYGKPIISSFVHMLHPKNAQVDSLMIQEKVMDKFNANLRNYIVSTLMPAVQANINDVTTSDDKVKRLKGMCTKDFSDTDAIAKGFITKLNSMYIRSPGDVESKIMNYSKLLDDIARESDGHIKRVELLVSQLLDTKIHLNEIKTYIQDMFIDIYNSFKMYYIGNSNNAHLTSAINNIVPNSINDMNDLLDYLNKFINASAMYITFLFTYQFQVALCEFVEVVEVHVETAQNDVLDFPNYSLVVPLETIVAIANAFTARGWKDLISREMTEQSPRDVNTNYIKGMVKFISNKLKVPNIFVIDREKGDVYYKLMYNSSVKNTKLRTIETFVTSNQNKEIRETWN